MTVSGVVGSLLFVMELEGTWRTFPGVIIVDCILRTFIAFVTYFMTAFNLGINCAIPEAYGNDSYNSA